MKKGLFINNKKAKDSIFESGYMVYQCLKKSNEYALDYIEVDINDRSVKTGYDFYFFNYHPVTMGWLQTATLKKELGFVITMILEVAPGDAFVMCPENHFNFYCAIDPTIKEKNGYLYAFPRPLEKIDFPLPETNYGIPVIGSFGFATKGKGFQHVVEAVNKEFDKALVRINIPYGDFVPESKEYAFFLAATCRKKAKAGVEVEVTHDFMSKEALIKWCAGNTLNCFLYDRDMPGLSATTDQVITSETALAVSDNDTFRHITAYLKPYPAMSLKNSIKESGPIVKKMKADWSPEIFTSKFVKVLFENIPLHNGKEVGASFLLPVKEKRLTDGLARKIKKYQRIFLNFNLDNFFKRFTKDEII